MKPAAYIVLFLVAIALLHGSASAAQTVQTPVKATDKSSTRNRSSLPITIKSNELAADNKGKVAIFSGKVVARQGDITIYADKLIVNYGEAKGSVEKIEATGNVRIVQANRTGIASQAVYDSRAGQIILTGSPKVIQENNTLTGKIITYYIDDEKSVVSGGGDSRIEAVINPPARKGHAGEH